MPKVNVGQSYERAGRNAHRNVDDTPNSAFSVLFEHGPDLRGIGEVTSVSIDHSAILFLVCRIFRKGGMCDLVETSNGGRKRVVVIVYGNDLVFACLLKSKDDMRAFTEGQRSICGR